MKKIVVISYSSQGTRQTAQVVQNLMAGLSNAGAFEVLHHLLPDPKPLKFPWSLSAFFQIFPETVSRRSTDSAPLNIDPADLYILATPVWYLSPALPMSLFLSSPSAQAHLVNRQIFVVLTCRNLWLKAYASLHAHLAALKCRIVGRVILEDRHKGFGNFITTPLWMLTGRKKYPGLSEAGVAPAEFARCVDTGKSLGMALLQNTSLPDVHPPVLERHWIIEKYGHKLFSLWANIIPSQSTHPNLRSLLLAFFVLTLILAILLSPVLAPIVLLYSKFFCPSKLAREMELLKVKP